MLNFFWDPSEIFKLLGMIETLFTNLWSCGCCLRWRWWWWINSHGSWKRIDVWTWKHVLDIDSWNHSDATMKDLWRRFSWRLNGWSRSWFKIMLWSWGPFVCQETNLFICVMKLIGLQVLDLLARNKIWYSSIAMVYDWFASVLSACFRSPLQFNCKLVRYCNIWLSCWTRRRGFPRCIPSCGFLT